MAALHCVNCDEDWPYLRPTYTQCPACNATTVYRTQTDAPDEVEALSRKRHHDFDRYLADRDQRRDNEARRLLTSLHLDQDTPADEEMPCSD